MTQKRILHFQSITALEHSTPLGSMSSQSQERCKTRARFATNHFQSDTSSQEWLTATKLLSSNHLRSTSKMLPAGLKPPQPALHRQTGQVLLVQPRVTHRPLQQHTFPSQMTDGTCASVGRAGRYDLEIASSRSVLQVASCEEFSALDFTQLCWSNNKILG